MTDLGSLSESTVARTIRQSLPGAVWSSLQDKWLVPPQELLQLILENRRLKGLPPVWGDVPERT